MKNKRELQNKKIKAIEQELFDTWDKKIGEILSDPVDADYWFRDNTHKRPSRILNNEKSIRDKETGLVKKPGEGWEISMRCSPIVRCHYGTWVGPVDTIQ